MEIVERLENLNKTGLEEFFGESLLRIAVEENSETLPRRLLDEAVVVASSTRDGKYPYCGPHMTIAGM